MCINNTSDKLGDLGSAMNKDGGMDADIQARIENAELAVQALET